MTIPTVDELAESADETVHWLGRLEAEIGQPVRRAQDTQARLKITGSPAPWNSELAGEMMAIEAAARQHVARLRRLLEHTTSAGTASTVHSHAAILALPALIGAAADKHTDDAGHAAQDLRVWPRRIRAVLDEARTDEIRMMKIDGPCPYCHERSLRVPADGNADVRCSTPWCHSHDGVPCDQPKACKVMYDRLRYRWERKDWARLLDDLAKTGS